jgi:hypothetical protein
VTLDRHDSTDLSDSTDSIDHALATHPDENADSADPAEPTDRIEPAEPIDSTEPTEPIDRIDPFDPMLRIESSDPTDHALRRPSRTHSFSPAGCVPTRPPGKFRQMSGRSAGGRSQFLGDAEPALLKRRLLLLDGA